MDVSELERQIEYKFAPAPLIAVQALANTYSFEDAEELLLNPQSARDWLVDSELTTDDVVVDEAGLRKLIEFRTLLRSLMDANLSGEQDREANDTLGRLAADHPVAMKVSGDGEVTLDVDPVGSIDELISQLVGITFQSQLDSTWPRLKICACDECRWAFFDSSRNRGGTWCQMEVCGNRIKTRHYRARQSAAK
jgi:predicted RNA-binding Zn ribbon-like protein